MPTYLVSDSFNRADSATLGSTDSSVGGTAKAWTSDSGAFQIKSNQLWNSIAGQSTVFLDAGVSNYSVSMVVNTQAGQNSLVLRWTDSLNNYTFLTEPLVNSVKLYKTQAGTRTQIATATMTLTAPYTMKASLTNGHFTCYINGAPTLLAADTFNQTATKVGVQNWSGQPFLDDFTLETAPEVLASDSFNRADSTTTLGTTDNAYGGTAYTWQVGGAAAVAYGIIGNQAYAASGAATDNNGAFIAIPTALRDYRLSLRVPTMQASSTNVFRAYPRVALSGGLLYYISLEAANTGYIVVKRTSSGGLTTLATSSVTPAHGDAIVIDNFASGQMDFYVNGAKIATLTDNHMLAVAYGVGFGGKQSPTYRVDDFMLEPISSTPTGPVITGAASLTGVGQMWAWSFRVVVSDSFNRPDSVFLDWTDSYMGGRSIQWYPPGYNDAFGIKNNQAYNVTNFSTIMDVDAGVSDCDISVQFPTLVSGSSGEGILGRLFDYDNFVYVQILPGPAKDGVDAQINIWKKVAGVFSQLTTDWYTATNTDVYKVRLQGPNVTVFRNGTQLSTANIPEFQTVVYHGVWLTDSFSRMDNFIIESGQRPVYEGYLGEIFGVGALTVASLITGSASLTGVGTLSAGGRTTAAGAATTRGVGTITATATLQRNGASSVTGVASITATATVQLGGVTGSANLIGVASLSASAGATKPASAGLTGVSAITASGGVVRPASASITGVASFTALAFVTNPSFATVNVQGVGTLAATATLVPAITGAAALTGVGRVTASGGRVQPASGTLRGVGVIAASGGVTSTARAALAGVATVAAVATVASATLGAATLVGTGGLAATALDFIILIASVRLAGEHLPSIRFPGTQITAARLLGTVKADHIFGTIPREEGGT